jgi:CelD/BcsL family acetyltransferase involved in cellulose biosynthesis
VPEAELIVDLARAEAVAEEWDALAVARGQPLSSPAWMLGWWRHVAPRSAELRIVAVHDRGSVIGLVPLYVELARRSTARCYRLLAHDFASVVSPLARPGREWDVAESTAALLAARDLRPDLLELGPLPVSASWAVALRERWPGHTRPLALRRKLLTVPTVILEGLSFDVWLAERSGHFRANIRDRQWP